MDNLIKKVVDFRNERDWGKFHNPKDSAISLLLEATEVLEHFQWKTPEEVKLHIKNHRVDIADELADVLYWILLMSHDLEINLTDAFDNKLKKNAKKYPVGKAKGNHTKYNQFS